ncbi:MAG TPA: efflux RND transporter periplasmic adaptor subunit, partial [Anaerolineae bacterium]
PGQVVGTREVLLGFEVSGQLAEIEVQPGDTVEAGAILARLNPRPLTDALETAHLELAQGRARQIQALAEARLDLQIAEAELRQETTGLPTLATSEAALAAAQARLTEIKAGPNENEMTVAAAALRQAEVELKQVQWAYDQVAYGADVGASPEAARLEAATLAYEAKQADYNLAVRDPAAADIAQAQAEVEQAQAGRQAHEQQILILEAQVEKARLALETLQAGIDPALERAVDIAQTQLEAATLTAPFAGAVLEVQAKPGETVLDGSGVILLADPHALEVLTNVIEEDLPLVQVGQPVEVFFDAVPEGGVQGRVARIVAQRIVGEERPLYPVYITLDQVPESIIAGMTADASIIIAQQTGVLRLPKALVRARSDGNAILEIWMDRQIERREVRAGLRGDVYVEIMAGLREGDEVVGR